MRSARCSNSSTAPSPSKVRGNTATELPSMQRRTAIEACQPPSCTASRVWRCMRARSSSSNMPEAVANVLDASRRSPQRSGGPRLCGERRYTGLACDGDGPLPRWVVDVGGRVCSSSGSHASRTGTLASKEVAWPGQPGAPGTSLNSTPDGGSEHVAESTVDTPNAMSDFRIASHALVQ